MVSINNNLGIGALKATAKAETANGLNDDTGKVKTLKASEQFPQEPDVQKQHYPNTNKDNPNLKTGDTFDDGKYMYKVTIGYTKEGERVVLTEKIGELLYS